MILHTVVLYTNDMLCCELAEAKYGVYTSRWGARRRPKEVCERGQGHLLCNSTIVLQSTPLLEDFSAHHTTLVSTVECVITLAYFILWYICYGKAILACYLLQVSIMNTHTFVLFSFKLLITGL